MRFHQSCIYSPFDIYILMRYNGHSDFILFKTSIGHKAILFYGNVDYSNMTMLFDNVVYGNVVYGNVVW